MRTMQLPNWFMLATGLLASAGAAEADEALQQASPSLWRAGIGSGFQSGAQTLTVEVGANGGLAAFGSVQAHDLILGSVSYGHMLGPMVGGEHWYHGNFEWRLEVFGGAEFSPSDEWVIGLTPHLRYNFSTASRWVPFLDIGAGVTATGIGPPDLSNTFEFNLQGGAGVHYFLRENLALTLSVHYLHLSCAGISRPNLGLNGVTGMLGLTWLF